ncbi:MAG: YkgJ family cysteine cluster protein [Spirochaetota bacterium]
MFKEAENSGLRFSCVQCGGCCTGSPGYVWLSEEDIQRLADAFALSREVFIQTYCIAVDIGEGRAVSLSEKEGFDCILLVEGRCSAYEARPVQCRTYPFWEEIVSSETSWREEAKHCPGIGKGFLHSPESIVQRILSRRAAGKYFLPDDDGEGGTL